MIDEARSRLEARDNASCLRVLAQYARRFPAPQLRQEATILRIEAGIVER